MNNYLFVYGSLLSDATNDFSRLLKDSSEFVGNGFIYAKKYDLGAYFGIKLDATEQNKIKGELYSISPKALEVVFRILDDYEGFISNKHPENLFHRIETIVHHNNDSTKAWVYEYSRTIDNLLPEDPF